MTTEPAGDDVTASAGELQALLLSTGDIEEFLQEMALLAAQRIAAGVSCGITLRRDGQPITVASSDALAAQVDEVQYGIEKGPCLHSMRTGEVVSVPDTAGEPQWAGFEVRAAAHGVGSSLSIPLTAEGLHVGAMNLYAPAANTFGTAERQRAKGFAATATGALALAVRQARQADLTDQLRAALTSRAVIDQALGVIMAQERCSPAQAFGILRAASQNRNVKLREIAASIVTAISGEPPQPPPFRDHRQLDNHAGLC
jgi:GAF domain-containing protein